MVISFILFWGYAKVGGRGYKDYAQGLQAILPEIISILIFPTRRNQELNGQWMHYKTNAKIEK